MYVFSPLVRLARRIEVTGSTIVRAMVGAAVSWTLCGVAGATEWQGLERYARDQSQAGDRARDGQPQAMKELRRQLLEHNRRWRAGAGQAPAVQQAPEALTGRVAEPTRERQPIPGLLSQPLSGQLSDPLSSNLSRTAPGVVDGAMPSERITSPLTEADSRLNEVERSILRQQLRESLRRQSGRENR